MVCRGTIGQFRNDVYQLFMPERIVGVLFLYDHLHVELVNNTIDLILLDTLELELVVQLNFHF